MSPIRVRNRHVEKQETVQDVQVNADFARLGKSAEIPKDAVLDLGKFKKANSRFEEARILQAIANKDIVFLREASDYFYNTSGIYKRLVNYLAGILTYDWMITPYINSEKNNTKVLAEFSKVLQFCDNLNIKSAFAEISHEVIKQGVYYGYRRVSPTRQVIQQLPTQYCRSRFKIDGVDLVEFNVQYFDDQIRDVNQRLAVLKSFPKEFQKGYLGMKNGTLVADPTDKGYWIHLEPGFGVKFNLIGSDVPFFTTVIPAILELDKAQEIYRKKSEQELLKIVIQKMPLTNDGELIFEIDEAADMHSNAVRMLSKAVGVDVLTTFADTEIASLVDKSSAAAAANPLSVVTGSVFTESGVSPNLFATDGNLALEKSVINDESLMFNLLAKYEYWLNYVLDITFNSNPKKLYFKIMMPRLSLYNYKEMAKLYKEMSQFGYSKLLPAIALGQSQSSVLATVHFENDILNLAETMVPVQSSATQSSSSSGSNETAGRPEKADDEKSEKTLQNKESQG